ncbi:MAG: glycosyltransferase family 2 protein [Nitrososphaerota archaeon]|jgi:glycosyltransferase involved in cell wall biosynthesis|nr:glycosyltransferase family 2 protein [Nitrososphaerota archaeon]
MKSETSKSSLTVFRPDSDTRKHYSICVTVFNESRSVKGALESVLSQVNDDFEIVVVDNESTDGTQKILAEMAAKYPMVKVIEAKCSRGKGRQISFENSTGAYIVANMDMDDEFEPALGPLLSLYHSEAEGNLLWVRSLPEVRDSGGQVHHAPQREWGGGVMIGPRKLIDELGGWRDLQRFEDLELAARAARHGRYRWGFYRVIEKRGQRNERVSFWGTVLDRFANLLVRSRRRACNGERLTVKQKVAVPLAYIFFFSYFWLRSPYRLFDPRKSRYYIPLHGEKAGVASFNDPGFHQL